MSARPRLSREQAIDSAVRRIFVYLHSTNETRCYGRQFLSVGDFLQNRGSWSSPYAGRINGMHTRMIRAEFRRIETEKLCP